MRTLFLLRGAPGSGKSTWVNRNNLEPYTLCADQIRTLIQCPVLNLNGTFSISQKNDKEVWEYLFHLLETRMARGEMLIIDATHYKKELLNKYKKLVKNYRYRVYVVDFVSGISMEECLRRNQNRTGYKIVPDHVIQKMYSVFNSESKQIRNAFTTISPEDAVKIIQNTNDQVKDFNSWEKIYIFGDIHGCFEPIKSFFEKYPYDEKAFYIFLGDYLDRGLQNKEVLEWAIEFAEHPNCLFLEGNHERWLKLYASKDSEDQSLIASRVFLKNTIPQIKDIDPVKIRSFCYKLAQMALFSYGKHTTWFCCHGGMPILPSLPIAAIEMIHGTGKYEDIDEVHKEFERRYGNLNIYQVHGHRNVYKDVFDANKIVFNLNSAVEYGEDLRILKLALQEDGSVTKELIEEPNLVHLTESNKVCRLYDKEINNDIIKQLCDNPSIIKIQLDDGIVSYKYDSKLFFSKQRTELNVIARGFFCRKDKIICRSYNKFFNYQERIETSPKELCKTLQFPVSKFQKENGFLGLVSWDANTDKAFIASKSTNQGEYAQMVRDRFYAYDSWNEMLNYAKEHNVTLIFEVIEPEKDPHIIEYAQPHLVLLDIIENTMEGKLLEYDKLKELANSWNIPCKILEHVYSNWEELWEDLKQLECEKDLKIEGFVFRDINNYQFKFKTNYYKRWKSFRSLKDKYARSKDQMRQVFVDKEETDFFLWLNTQPKEYVSKTDIIALRQQFLKNKGLT